MNTDKPILQVEDDSVGVITIFNAYRSLSELPE